MEHHNTENKDTKKIVRNSAKYCLYGICNNINVLVESYHFGALSTDERSTNGYYMVKFLSSPYII